MLTLIEAPRFMSLGTALLGQSPEAEAITEFIQGIQKRRKETISYGSYGERLRGDLTQVLRECDTREWKNEGGEAISEFTINQAQAFIDCLPENIQVPETDVTLRGMILFQWLSNREANFSAMISSEKGYYAGVFGHRRVSDAWLLGYEIPQEVIELLTQYFPSL